MLLSVATAEAMEQLGARLGAACAAGGVVYLQGELGAGKTTLVRGLLHGVGHQGVVKSPTYTLVESYDLPAVTAYHFDLYRVSAAEELEFMGLRDYFTPASLCLIEWPECGAGLLPPADLAIDIGYASKGRQVRLLAESARGASMLTGLRLA